MYEWGSQDGRWREDPTRLYGRTLLFVGCFLFASFHHFLDHHNKANVFSRPN